MRLGNLMRNPLDRSDLGIYQITAVKRYHMVWMYTATPWDKNCTYASIGGVLR